MESAYGIQTLCVDGVAFCMVERVGDSRWTNGRDVFDSWEEAKAASEQWALTYGKV